MIPKGMTTERDNKKSGAVSQRIRQGFRAHFRKLATDGPSTQFYSQTENWSDVRYNISTSSFSLTLPEGAAGLEDGERLGSR